MRSISAVADGESFSQDLGTEWGESGSAATVVASASHGADADSDHESTASGGAERGATLQKEVVALWGFLTTRSASVSFLPNVLLPRTSITKVTV